MTEMKQIAGFHCKKQMDMRITDIKDDATPVLGWIIYGVCKKCKTIVMSGLFIQTEKPVLDVDYTITNEEVVEAKTTKEA